MGNIFFKHLKLLKGPIYTKINKFPTFTLVSSIFRDSWYNFIVPSVSDNEFNWELSEGLIQKGNKNAIKFPYYIKDNFIQNYKDRLVKLGYKTLGDNTYMLLVMKKKFGINGENIKEIQEKQAGAYIKIAQSCFPEFETEEQNCRRFLNLSRANTNKDLTISNLSLTINRKIAAFASLYSSKKLNLAYLHNDGTAEEFRRKGFHKMLIQKRCNMAFDFGIKNIYAILEEGGASFYSYSKLGFKPIAKYTLFSK